MYKIIKKLVVVPLIAIVLLPSFACTTKGINLNSITQSVTASDTLKVLEEVAQSLEKVIAGMYIADGLTEEEYLIITDKISNFRIELIKNTLLLDSLGTKNIIPLDSAVKEVLITYAKEVVVALLNTGKLSETDSETIRKVNALFKILQ